MQKSVNKLITIITMFLLVVSTLFTTYSPVNAATQTLADGEYTIDLKFLKDGSEAESVMDEYVEKPATLIVKDGEKYVELTLKNSDWIKYLKLGRDENGQDVVVKSIDNVKNIRVVSFKVESLSEKVEFYTHVLIPMLNYDNKYNVQLKFDELSIVAVNVPEVPTLADGIYTVDLAVLKDQKDQASSMQSYVENPVKLTVKEGKKIAELTLKSSDMIPQFQVEQDGEYKDTTTINEDTEAKKRTVKFEVAKLSEKINAKVTVDTKTDYGIMTHTVQLKFNVDSITEVEESTAPGTPTNPGSGNEETPTNPGSGNEETPTNPGSGNGQTPTNPGTPGTGNEETPKGPEEYTIDFNVYKDGTNSISVMDDYTQKPANLKVRDGKNYVSVTLLNSSWIKTFQVAGSSTTVVSTDHATNTRVVEFEVKDLSKPVNAQAHVYIPANEFPGGMVYDNQYTVQFKFDPSSKTEITGSNPTPTDPTTENTIKANDGGKYEGNGVVIQFPAASFASDFKVTVEKLTNPSSLPLEKLHSLVSDVLEIKKDQSGDFKKAITLTFKFDKTKVDNKKQDVAIFWFNETTKKWVKLDNIKADFATGVVSGEVNHFTKFAVLAVDKTEQPSVNLTDIKGHWAEEYITALVKTAAITGHENGEFRPNNQITRAGFTAILVRALGLEIVKDGAFDDTKNHWAKDYIATARANGIVKGYSTTQFGPDNLINREQMAIMITQALGLQSKASTLSFKDANQISPWAQDAVRTVFQEDIMKGYSSDNTFKPKDKATRAQTAAVIFRALNK
ncbi:NEAT domain-containing protein [Peribacillus sp. JNUCC 23]